MSRQKESKKSLPLHLGEFKIPTKEAWNNWKTNEVHEIEFGGLKFFAASNGYSLVAGPKLEWTPYGFQGGQSMLSFTRRVADMMGDSNSCAYQRVYPTGKTREALLMWAWWLDNFPIPRGTVCYLTQKDGDVKDIKKVLNRRGFRLACVTKSKHAGHYPVYLLTHPGDEALKNKKNKGTQNADVLGNPHADVSKPRIAGVDTGPYEEVELIPAAPEAIEGVQQPPEPNLGF